MFKNSKSKSDHFKPGDPVIFSMPKSSTCPGPRAREVHSTPHGDTYNYVVTKFWRVKDIDDEGRLVLVTRRGKKHIIEPSHPSLKKPGFLMRILHHSRFPYPA